MWAITTQQAYIGIHIFSNILFPPPDNFLGGMHMYHMLPSPSLPFKRDMPTAHALTPILNHWVESKDYETKSFTHPVTQSSDPSQSLPQQDFNTLTSGKTTLP